MKRLFAPLAIVLLLATPDAKSAAPEDTRPVVRLGVMAFTPQSGPYTTYIREDDLVLKALPGLLRSSLPQYRFEVSVQRTSELVAAARGGKVDVVFGSSGCFSQLLPDGIYPLATLVTNRAPDPNRAVAGAVIVRADRTDLKSLTDLKGKRATGGLKDMFFNYQLPASAFLDRKLDPEKTLAAFSHVDYPVAKTLEAVRSGAADAGFIRACVLEELPKEVAREFRVLDPVSNSPLHCAHTSRLFPNWTVGSMPGLSPRIARDISYALLGSKPETGIGIQWGIANKFGDVDSLFKALHFGRYEYLNQWTAKRLWEVGWPFVLAAAVALIALILHLLTVKDLVRRRTAELSEEIENRKRLERENAEVSLRFHRLERASTMGLLSNMMAHEVRQPLAASHALLHTIGMVVKREKITSPVLLKALSGAEFQTERIGEIVNHVCSYYRSGHRRVPVRLAEIVRDVLQEASQIGLARYPVSCSIEGDPVVMGDPLELKLVIYNLVKNSVEAARGADPGVRIRLTASAPDAVLVCSDSTGSVTKADVERIQGFGQSGKEEGLGLGLSIVRAVVESHAGTIEFQRNAECGLTATVKLPLSESGEQSDDA